MFDLDLLISPKDDILTIYAPTKSGQEAMERYLKHIIPRQSEDGLLVVHLPAKEGMTFYKKVRRYRVEDVDMYYFPNEMASYEEVRLAARARATKFREDTVRKEVIGYYEPKITAAIDARDGSELRRLLDAMPSNMAVEKSFIVMRAREAFNVKNLSEI